MRKFIYLPLIACSLLAFTNLRHTLNDFSVNTLTDQEKKEGWELLFDGKTTSGWHAYGQDKANDSWKIADGALTLNPDHKEGGDLVTNKEYSNYDLKLEWKISEKGNSGVIFYVHEDPQYKATYNTGMEMQVLDNGTPT